MAHESRLRVQEQNGVMVVGFVDNNILDENNIQLIGSEISAIIEAAALPRLLLSFADVEHLSSAALGTLITINTQVRNKNGKLCLTEIDPQIYEVFVITKLNTIFEITDTPEQAMTALQG